MKTFNEIRNVIVEGKEETKAIRSILKRSFNLSNRDVSVKTKNGGYDSSVSVTIKSINALSKMKEIETLGNDYQKYDIDQYSGEILTGGNTYVFTEIDYKFRDKLVSMINKEYEKMSKKGSHGIKLYKTFEVRESDGGLVVWNDRNWAEVRRGQTVGDTMMEVISKSKDDSLYKKIK